MKYIFIPFLLLSGCTDTSSSAEAPPSGKYEFTESGTNVTETHSHFVTTNLVIKGNNVEYFNTDNGDIIGKERLLVSKDRFGISLLYSGCVTQSTPDDPEEECPPKRKIGEKRFSVIFNKKNNSLTLKEHLQPDVTLTRVKTFSFE